MRGRRRGVLTGVGITTEDWDWAGSAVWGRGRGNSVFRRSLPRSPVPRRDLLSGLGPRSQVPLRLRQATRALSSGLQQYLQVEGGGREDPNRGGGRWSPNRVSDLPESRVNDRHHDLPLEDPCSGRTRSRGGGPRGVMGWGWSPGGGSEGEVGPETRRSGDQEGTCGRGRGRTVRDCPHVRETQLGDPAGAGGRGTEYTTLAGGWGPGPHVLVTTVPGSSVSPKTSGDIPHSPRTPTQGPRRPKPPPGQVGVRRTTPPPSDLRFLVPVPEVPQGNLGFRDREVGNRTRDRDWGLRAVTEDGWEGSGVGVEWSFRPDGTSDRLRTSMDPGIWGSLTPWEGKYDPHRPVSGGRPGDGKGL